MTTTVVNQQELDAATKAGVTHIIINSPAGVWLTVRTPGSSHVEAWESSHVVARGSSHVVAWESSHVVARGSSHVVAWESSHVVAWGSSHVEAWGSSHVVARGSSHVEAWESSHVEAWESSHVVAQPYVAVHIHSQRVTLSGGVVIDMTKLELGDPAAWCEFHGVTVTDGIATLYKATDATLTAGQSYVPVTYDIRSSPVARDWKPTATCGNGLHLGPTTSHATAYRSDAARWVRVEVPLADIVPIPGDPAKCKVRTCRVVAEVDRYGRDLVVQP